MKRIIILLLLPVIAVTSVGRANPAGDLFGNGGFFIGCNYWARHAGMYMWSRWDQAEVEKEVAALAKEGVGVMRVFPLWSDFQPLTRVHVGGNAPSDFLQANGPLQNPAGVDEEMMRRFRIFCDIAEKNRIRLIVGLITGWMSGRMFQPPALETVNALTDPEAIMWETRFVSHFVTAMKDHPAIAAWDFGNECNGLGNATTAEFYNWMRAIGSAIRLADPSRPVVAGMHGLSTMMNRKEPIRNVGELSDVLTTHPYSFYVNGCAQDPLGTLRPTLHPSAESLFYRDLGGKPCFIEEIGNLGTAFNSEERTAAAMRSVLFTAWANDLKGFLWWCNSDQEGLGFPPYDWTPCERELGMLRQDLSPKPVMKEMRAFEDFRRSLPFAALPPRRTDCVIVVPERTDGWIAGFGAYLLAVQAGLNPVFAGAEHELPERSLYLVCSADNEYSYTYSAQRRIFARAEAGATVFVFHGGQAKFTRLAENAGLTADYSAATGIERKFALPERPDRLISCGDGATCRLMAKGCEVLARTADGEPALTVFKKGAGRTVVCNSPLDRAAIWRTDVLRGANPMPYYLVLEKVRQLAGIRGVVEKKDAPSVHLTEHPMPDGSTLIVAVNCEDREVNCPIVLHGKLGKVYRGNVSADRILLGANEAAVFVLLKGKNTPLRRGDVF